MLLDSDEKVTIRQSVTNPNLLIVILEKGCHGDSEFTSVSEKLEVSIATLDKYGDRWLDELRELYRKEGERRQPPITITRGTQEQLGKMLKELGEFLAR